MLADVAVAHDDALVAYPDRAQARHPHANAGRAVPPENDPVAGGPGDQGHEQDPLPRGHNRIEADHCRSGRLGPARRHDRRQQKPDRCDEPTSPDLRDHEGEGDQCRHEHQWPESDHHVGGPGAVPSAERRRGHPWPILGGDALLDDARCNQGRVAEVGEHEFDVPAFADLLEDVDAHLLDGVVHVGRGQSL